MTNSIPPQDNPSKDPYWKSELEFTINSLKSIPSASEIFGKKLMLEGYLKALFNARLIDSEQADKYASQIDQIIYSKLYN